MRIYCENKIVLLIILISVSILHNPLISCAQENKLHKNYVAKKDLALTFKVKGVTCASDFKSIESNVQKIKGINHFEVVKQGAISTLLIIFDPDFTNEEEITAGVENTPGCEDPSDRPYKVKMIVQKE